MSSKRRLIFGDPPFGVLAEYLAQDKEFLDDARLIVDINEEAFLQLATRLSKTNTFLSRSELETVVSEVVGKGADRIASILYRLAGIVHGADMDALKAMEILGKAIEEKAESLEPPLRRKFSDRIRTAVAESVGFAKQFKARRLVGAIGTQLDDFRIICDIRPIFDSGHQRIDGAVPITVLRLEYTRPEDETGVLEVRVTEKQLAKFGEKIADASLKLKMIKGLLSSNDIAIPSTKSTAIEED